ncbi:hypothetical protein TNCT_66371 [Trichonephila clavata]|uniref:Uncharacterized protein n=1 Tax=Trichonephila clavata TaxID=2740835 RepID=A0A8X6G8P7_TRICU|nr:hypothetical protein TNCT_66371 [Trichonephila clavata]
MIINNSKVVLMVKEQLRDLLKVWQDRANLVNSTSLVSPIGDCCKLFWWCHIRRSLNLPSLVSKSWYWRTFSGSPFEVSEFAQISWSVLA